MFRQPLLADFSVLGLELWQKPAYKPVVLQNLEDATQSK